VDELLLVKEILKVFREASGLVTNISKSSFTPIRSGSQEVEVVQQILSCNIIVNFHVDILGCLLSWFQKSGGNKVCVRWEDASVDSLRMVNRKDSRRGGVR
jgi:hypothetical protein